MADEDVDGTPSIPLIESRTAAGVDDECGMRYWWNFLEAGTGIVPTKTPEYFEVGREIHEDVAEIAEWPDKDLTPEGIAPLIEARLVGVTEEDHVFVEKMERLYRRLGWLAAFALYLEPRLREEFENVTTEEEIILDRDPLWVPITPDRVLRHRRDRYLVYKEFKSAISAGPKWMASWLYAIQLHAGMAAIQEELGEKVAYGQIIGLMKGDARGNRLSHPYVWAWRSTKTGAWEHEYAKARTAEWEHAPVWEFPGGIIEWVRRLGPEVARNQFPHSAPVFLNERILNDWVNRRTVRQATIKEIAGLCQHDWDTRVLYFEPRVSKCRPAFGDECAYLRCCNNAEINANPLASDQFIRRTPHHELEIIGVDE